jgi:hypothetical protein
MNRLNRKKKIILLSVSKFSFIIVSKKFNNVKIMIIKILTPFKISKSLLIKIYYR